MKLTIVLISLLLTMLPWAIMAEETDHGEKSIKVQAWSFHDASLDAEKGDPCADFLTYLMGNIEKYQLLNVSGVNGPPGVVYTLQNNEGEIAILKCGTAGGCSHDSGGGGH